MLTLLLLALGAADAADTKTPTAEPKPVSMPAALSQKCLPIIPPTLRSCEPHHPWPQLRRVSGGPVVVILDSGIG